MKSKTGLPPLKCGHCSKLLAKGHIARLEIRCPRCGRDTVFILEPLRAESPNYAENELQTLDYVI